jgi:hypothetical protein
MRTCTLGLNDFRNLFNLLRLNNWVQVFAIAALTFFHSMTFADLLKPSKEDGKAAWFKPAEFVKLHIEGSADITVRQGNENEIIIDASPQARERIEIYQDGSQIKIRFNGGWKFWDNNAGSLRINITFKTLEDVALSGSGNLHGKGKIKLPKLSLRMAGAGDFDFEDLHVDDLRVSLAGAGDAKLMGEAKSLTLSIAGAGDYVGEKFKAQKARISIAGAGDAKVWATEELSVSIAGAGSVSHWGRPKIIKQSIAGVGSINDRGEKP